MVPFMLPGTTVEIWLNTHATGLFHFRDCDDVTVFTLKFEKSYIKCKYYTCIELKIEINIFSRLNNIFAGAMLSKKRTIAFARGGSVSQIQLTAPVECGTGQPRLVRK